MRDRHLVPLAVAGLLLVGAAAYSQGYQPDFVRNFVGAINVFGTLTVTGATSLQAVTATTIEPLTSLRNSGTAAACSSNTGAVCVNDANGQAWANGSGTTVATMSNAGKATIATLAITATTDLGAGSLDVTGGATATVRALAKCFCWDGTTGNSLTCTLSGTTLTISNGSNGDAYYFFCPTQS